MSLIKYIRLLPAVVLLCISTEMSAQEFEVDGISYVLYLDGNSCTAVDVKDKEDVVIPATVRYKKQNYPVCRVYDGALENSPGVRSVTIPSTIKHLNGELFMDCMSLVSINVDGDNSYYTSVDGVLYNKNKTKIVKYPSGKTGNSFIIPQSVDTIGSYAFYDCKNLCNVFIPENVRGISPCAFSGCSNLQRIKLPHSIVCIESCAFSDCSSLTQVDIPDEVIAVDMEAFSGCTNLEKIVFSKRLREIGIRAFSECVKLKSVCIPLSVDSIDVSAFSDCMSLTNMEIDEASPHFMCRDGVLYNKDMTAIVCYPGGKTASSYTIPASVGKIDAIVFSGNSYLSDVFIDKSDSDYVSIEGVLYDKDLHTVVYCPPGKLMQTVVFPKSVTEIGSYAFYRHEESSIVIPDNIKFIGFMALGCSNKVTNLTIGKSIDVATEFTGFGNLKTIRVHCPVPPYFEDGFFFEKKSLRMLCCMCPNHL